MNFQDVYKKIAEDINYLFTNMANTLKYDKTFRAKVISQESTGKYKILYKNVEYTAKCDGRLNAGDLVWVFAPRNDWNELYVQLGGAIQNQVNQTNSNLSKLGALNMNLFRANFDSANNRIVLEFYISSNEIYYLKFGTTTKEIILDAIINGVYSRPWTFK